MSIEFPITGQGAATVATESDIVRDAVGFTHPNLHRRIVSPATVTPPIKRKHYVLGVYGVHSFRTTRTVLHDEASTTSEIP